MIRSLTTIHESGRFLRGVLVVGTACLFLSDAQAVEEPAAPAADAPIAIADVRHEGPVDFEREILPLLSKNCLACHGRGNAESDLVLETPQTILTGGASGPAVVAGKSADSLLLQVAARTSEPFMPPADNKIGAKSFTSEELGLIKLWIDQGAQGEVKGAAPVVWQSLPPGVNPILAVAVSDDGQYAACGRANQIFVYHLPSARLAGRLTDPALIDGKLYTQPGVAHHDLVQSLAFSPDGFTLASGGYRDVKLWQRPNSVVARELPTGAGTIAAQATSADGKWLATAGQDFVVRLWDLAAGQPGPALPGHGAGVTAIAFSPDGARVYSAANDRTLRAWDLASNAEAARIVTPGIVRAIAATGEANQVAIGGDDGLIRLQTLEAATPTELPALAEAPTALATSADEATLLVGLADGAAQLVESAAGNVKQTFASLGAPVTSAAISHDNKFVVLAAGKRATMLDAATGSAIASCDVDSAAIARLALSPAGNRLALGEFDGSVSIWDVDMTAKSLVRRGRAAPKGQPISGMAYSPDGALVFAVTADGLLSAYSESLEKPVYEVRPDGPTHALALSPDGRWLALAGSDGVVRFVRAADGVASEAPAPASAGSAIELLAFAKHGRRLAAVTRDYRVLVYDFVPDPAPQVYLAESISSGPGQAMAAAWAGDRLLETTSDRALRTWALPPSTYLAGHTGCIARLVAIPASKQLVSGSADGSVRQWDLAGAKELRKFDLGGPVTSLALTPDAARLAAGGAHGAARLWQVADGAQIAEFKGDFRSRGRVTRLTEEQTVYKQKVDALTAAVAAAEKDLADKIAAAQAAVDAFPPTETAAVEATAKLDVATKAKEDADKLAADTAAQVAALAKSKADADKLAADTAAVALAAADTAAKAQAALDAQTQANATLAAVAQAAKATVEKRPDDAGLTAAVGAADKAVADFAPALESAKNLQALWGKLGEEKQAAAKLAAEEQAKVVQALATAEAAAKTAADAKAATEKTFAEVAAATKTATDARDNAKRAMAESARASEAATAALPLAKSNLEMASATFGQVQAELAAGQQALTASELPVRSMAISPDGKTLALAGDDQAVQTFSAETGKPFEQYRAANGPVNALAFAADGSLVSAAQDGVLRTWEAYPAWNLARTLGPVVAAADPAAAADASPAAPEASDSLLTDRVLALAFSPDGKTLATGGGEPSRSGEIRLWNVADGTPGLALHEPHSDTVFGLEFSSDGRYLASAAADKFVKVFDAVTGKMLRSYEWHTHHDLSTSWRFDGHLLASGGADGVIKIWNFDTGEQERTIAGYKKEVTSTAFVGTGGMLLASSADKTVRLQNADDGKGVRNFGGETDFVYAARVTPDGGVVVAGGQDSVLRAWNGADGKLMFDLPPPAAEGAK